MIAAFANRYDLTETRVFDMMAARDRVGVLNERWNNATTEESRYKYEQILTRQMDRMRRLAESNGFGVSFDHGIYPVLTKDGNVVCLPE